MDGAYAYMIYDTWRKEGYNVPKLRSRILPIGEVETKEEEEEEEGDKEEEEVEEEEG